MSTESRGPTQSASSKRSLDLRHILEQPIDEQYKSFPINEPPLRISEVAAQRWNALEDPFSTPLMLLKEESLRHNLQVMHDYCQRHAVSLAPHCKTPLSPQLAQLQLDAAAWGFTVANVHQARVLRRAGATRLLIANEVLDSVSAQWLAQALAADPDLELYCLVDSVQGAQLLHAHLATGVVTRPVSVLLELGIPGGRCGCRSVDEAMIVAAEIGRLETLELAGIEVYENLFPVEHVEQTVAHIASLFARFRDLARRLDEQDAFGWRPEIILTGGGSMWFDLVVAGLDDLHLSRPVRKVLRAGSYLTHDAAEYAELSPFGRRDIGEGTLRQALELWARVISMPEPGLAILDFGKRDAAHDRGFPKPFAAKTGNLIVELDDADYEVFHLNDQHARLRIPDNSILSVGDLLGCHISHPCTSFDNWRLIPMVDRDYTVVDAIRSFL
jgi:D-serine deaminase-like pyridoxal phosphate-dependent protein